MNENIPIFITGTDTGIGKTFITALLAACLMDKGYRIGVQKWISTGDSDVCQDTQFVHSVALDLWHGRDGQVPLHLFDQGCYRLSFPSSPHLAAEIDGVRIDNHVIEREFSRARDGCDILLVEGVGGVMVPLSRRYLLIDLVARLKIPAMVVARSGLGTLNHTLLTINALRERGISVIGIVLNSQAERDEEFEDKRIVEDNKLVLSDLGHIKVFGPVERVRHPLDALGYIEPVAKTIIRACVKNPVLP